MSEDEELPVDGRRVGRSLRDALECPVCFEYMTPPITMCESGHNLCWACRPRLDKCPTCRQPLLGTRNVALEHLSRELPLPCRNTNSGCQESRPVTLLSHHQDDCPYEPAYACPLECGWTGQRAEIKGHAKETHADKVLEGTPENGCRWELPLIVRDTRVMFAYGEVFRYRERLHTLKKLFYIAVQFVGPRSEAPNFKYEAELRTATGDQKVMVMGNATLEDQQDIDAVYEAGKCITLDYDLVKNVAQGNQLVFSVSVSRVGS